MCVLIKDMAQRLTGRGRVELVPLVALLLLCFLWSLGSLRADLLPNATSSAFPPMAREAIPLGLLAVAAGLFSAIRGAPWPGGRQLGACVLVGIGLFVAPAALLGFAATSVPSLEREALLSLCPVFAVVLEPHLGPNDSKRENKGVLVTAFAAMAGTLCLFPVEVPNSIAAGGGFCAVILAAATIAVSNGYAVRIAHDIRPKSIATFAAVAGGTAALSLFTISLITEHAVWNWNGLRSELTWPSAVELPALLLLFWLMRRVSAARMTTRFVVSPLLTILISAALFRPEIEARGWLGIVLMAAGSGWMLLGPVEDEETGSSSLDLNR